MGFDTGCGAGIIFTDALEGKIAYKVLGSTEALNRDGSHRGWDKRIILDEFSVFGERFENVVSHISDWKMYSTVQFNGLIGLAFFEGKVLTLDYIGQRIAVKSTPIDYDRLDPDKYLVLPLYHSTSPGQETLPFFPAKYKGTPIMVYLDTGKNYSYVCDGESKGDRMEKPADFCDIAVEIGGVEVTLFDVVKINQLAQAEGLPYPTVIELNSDQIWKNKILVTLDLIEQKIIFGGLK